MGWSETGKAIRGESKGLFPAQAETPVSCFYGTAGIYSNFALKRVAR